MKKIDLQDGKFFKIRQRADGSYEGKFGPDGQAAPQQPKAPEHTSAQAAFQAAPAPSSGGWSPVSINPNRTFTLPTIGTFPLPAAGEMKKIDLQDGKFFKIRQRADGAYEGKFGPDALPAPQQTKAPSQPPPGWQRVNVDADGMVRLPNFAAPLYPPHPGQTETIHIDPRTTFIMRRAEDGEVHGTFETKAPTEPPPGWTRVNVDSDGMIRLPGRAQSFYPPQPGKTETLQLDDKTTFILSHTADGEIFGTFETKAPPEEEEALDDQPGLDVDDSKREYEGVVTTRMKDGKKVVDVGALGTLVAPAVGGHDSYLMELDKLLVLHGRPDGTVEVSTRKLGIEPKGSGFKGALLPSEGKLEFAGDVYDVSKLQPGQKIKDSIRIKGENFKVEVRMNHDGSVTITGKQKKGWLEQVLDFAGKFLPVLAAIPGLGLVAIAAKVVTVFNAVRSFAQSLKNGNLLGMVGSAASVAVNFSQGAFQAFASKVANLASVGQQVVTTLAHGMGKGLLQVVSNGANLVSGIAQAAADLGQGGFQRGAINVAQVANSVGGYAGGVDSAVKGDLTPLLAHAGKDVVNHVVSKNPPQAQNPVAGTEYSFSTQPLTPFGSPPSAGYSFSTQPLTPFELPPTDPPLINKGPKKPTGKKLVLDDNNKKKPVGKELVPNLNQAPNKQLEKDLSLGNDRPFAPKEDPELVAALPNVLLASTPPDQQTIRQRVSGFFRGLVTEVVNQGQGLLDAGKAIVDMHPLTYATGAISDIISATISKKDAGAMVGQRTQEYVNRYRALAGQTVELVNLVNNIVGPGRALNELKMYKGIFDDMRAQQRPLTVQTVLQIIGKRMQMNPSHDAAKQVLDAYTNYKRILDSGGEPQEVGKAAVRIFMLLAPLSKAKAQGFGKVNNTPGRADDWNNPGINRGTGLYGEAVEQGIQCGGFVCAWAKRTEPVKKYTGTPRVPTGTMSGRQVEAWLRQEGLLRPNLMPRTFQNSTEAIKFMEKNGGRYAVFKEGAQPGMAGHAFAVEVRNGGIITRDPAGGVAADLWSDPTLSGKTRVVPIK